MTKLLATRETHTQEDNMIMKLQHNNLSRTRETLIKFNEDGYIV